jgi:hypothetical protein
MERLAVRCNRSVVPVISLPDRVMRAGSAAEKWACLRLGYIPLMIDDPAFRRFMLGSLFGTGRACHVDRVAEESLTMSRWP